MADETSAVLVLCHDGIWEASVLPDRLADDLDSVVGELRRQAAEDGAIAFLSVEDEFFVAARMVRGEPQLLLSDRTTVDEFDIARQALRLLGEDLPDDDDLDDVWPAGDLAMFTDFGLDERELGTILDDLDLYADEMILAIGRRVGFADAYAEAADLPPQ